MTMGAYLSLPIMGDNKAKWESIGVRWFTNIDSTCNYAIGYFPSVLSLKKFTALENPKSNVYALIDNRTNQSTHTINVEFGPNNQVTVKIFSQLL